MKAEKRLSSQFGSEDASCGECGELQGSPESKQWTLGVTLECVEEIKIMRKRCIRPRNRCVGLRAKILPEKNTELLKEQSSSIFLERPLKQRETLHGRRDPQEALRGEVCLTKVPEEFRILECAGENTRGATRHLQHEETIFLGEILKQGNKSGGRKREKLDDAHSGENCLREEPGIFRRTEEQDTRRRFLENFEQCVTGFDVETLHGANEATEMQPLRSFMQSALQLANIIDTDRICFCLSLRAVLLGDV
jgi:hypothetical protein